MTVASWIWHLIDYFVAVFSALLKDKEVNTRVGLPQGTFEEGSINNAFYLCIILFVGNILYSCNSYKQR